MGIQSVGRICRRFFASRNRMMSSCGGGSSAPISPCLLLNSSFKKGGDMVYKFYSLKSEREIKWNKRGIDESGEVPPNACKIVGSSHGCLALFNERNNDLFLSDPLHRRHMKLPSIEILPDPGINLVGGKGSVSKLITTCSPFDDQEECHVMMTYGPGDRLAFFSPASGTDWIPLGDITLEPNTICRYGQIFEDFAFCRGRKLFSSLTPCFKISMEYGSICQKYSNHKCGYLDWNTSPFVVSSGELPVMIDDERSPVWGVEQMNNYPIQTSHLVYAESSDQLFLLVRFVDGSPIPYEPYLESPTSINDPFVLTMYEADFSYKTVGFIALRVDKEDDEDEPVLAVVDSLDGLAMFVGLNHSFAIPASELNLKPNSIYFTDVGSRIKGPNYSGKRGGFDVGIFDYQKNIISPCRNFPTLSKKLRRSPVWFTPNIDLDALD